MEDGLLEQELAKDLDLDFEKLRDEAHHLGQTIAREALLLLPQVLRHTALLRGPEEAWTVKDRIFVRSVLRAAQPALKQYIDDPKPWSGTCWRRPRSARRRLWHAAAPKKKE